MNTKVNLASLSREIVTEADAYLYLESLRWRGEPQCAHCDGTDVYFIEPANGVSRKSAGGTMSERRVWKCRPCRKQFSVLTGTIMHATKISVRTWVLVLFQMCSSKNGVSAREVGRMYGLCERTAWHMLHRIRSAMSGGERLVSTMRGTIVADETYYGGDPKNRHASDPRLTTPGRGTDKMPVLSLVNVTTGEARSKVVPNVRAHTLRKFMAENVDMAASTLWTDMHRPYQQIGMEFASHTAVDHEAGQYVDARGAGTNAAEGYFAQFKRSVDGTHHHVSVEHLQRYVDEFDFRYTTCHASDYARMRILGKQLEGRLGYKRVIDHTGTPKRTHADPRLPLASWDDLLATD